MDNTTDMLTRSFAPDLEVLPPSKGGDGRTIVGIAVPYSKPQRIDARLTEQMAPGVFSRQVKDPSRVRFSREHLALGGHLIGKTSLLRNDTNGLYGEWRASKTPIGDETVELVRDGALTDLSVAFRSGQNRRLPGGVVERVTGTLVEVAVVLDGAYGTGAQVSGVRSHGHSGTDEEFTEDVYCPRCAEQFINRDRAAQILATLPVLPSL